MHASNILQGYTQGSYNFERFHLRDVGILNPFRRHVYQSVFQGILCSLQYILCANLDFHFPKEISKFACHLLRLFSKGQNQQKNAFLLVRLRPEFHFLIHQPSCHLGFHSQNLACIFSYQNRLNHLLNKHIHWKLFVRLSQFALEYER